MIGRLRHSILWDLRLQIRRGYPWIALGLLLAGMVALRLLPVEVRQGDLGWGLLLVYMLLAVFLPLCRHIRREKSEGILVWLNATPLRPHEYLAAKIAAWAPVSVAGGLVLAFASHGPDFRPLPLLAGVLLALILSVMAAFIAMAYPRNPATAVLSALLAALALALPLLPQGTGFGLFLHPMLTVIALVTQAFNPFHPMQIWILALGLGSASIWLGAGLFLCKRAYGHARSAPLGNL